MTQKQFKQALLRGQGRCILAARAEPERYFKIVLWACSHEIAYDPQCEGTRSWFVYQLTQCYSDPSPFLKAALESFGKAKSDGGWKVLYLAELLSCFANTGSEEAQKALWDKYKALYALLWNGKRPTRFGIFPERDDFEMLCLVLAQNKAAFTRIALDIGRLFRHDSFFGGSDFDWLYDSKGKGYARRLQKEIRQSEDLAAYFEAYEIQQKEREAICADRPENRPKGGIALSVWLKRRADAQTILQYADLYLAQTDPEKRAEALKAFWNCPYPQDPQPVIMDAGSDCEALQETAWEALSNVQHPAVREFALEHLQKDPEHAIHALIPNYEKQDAALLDAAVRAIPVDHDDTTGWHGVHLAVLSLPDSSRKIPAPTLAYLYETNHCSCCREHILRQMGRQRILTDEILQECLWDCNDDIRAYAKQCLRRRNAKK